MRIKFDNTIEEVEKVTVRTEVSDIGINGKFYRTGDKTNAIGEQLLKDGYADLSSYSRS